MKQITLIILSSLLFPIIGRGQNFGYKAKLQPVSTTGFYRININPEVGARSQPQFNDLRIFDNDGKEIPYLLKKEIDGNNETQFVTYPLTSSIEKNKQIIVVENSEKRKVSLFQFVIKNADASRLVRISGSDDNQKWYVVRDSFYFESVSQDDDALVKKQLTFPATDYRYYKVEMAIGNNESPLNIINAGNYKTTAQEAGIQIVKGLSFTRVDSNKTTYLKFTCRPANRIDKLELVITSPEMYHRKALLKGKTIHPESDGPISSTSKYNRTATTAARQYDLSSDRENRINCSDLLGYQQVGEFTLEIQNQDDQPLDIKAVKAYQLTTTATAKLEQGKTYFLYFGDSLMQAPAYDIVYFANTVSDSGRIVQALAVQPKAQKDKDEYNGAKDKYIVWIGLGLVGVIIFFLTMNMMKKMKPE
jgi:hypothetical protein